MIEQFILPDHQRYTDRFRNLRLATNKIQAQGIEISTFEERYDNCLTDFDWEKMKNQKRSFANSEISFLIFNLPKTKKPRTEKDFSFSIQGISLINLISSCKYLFTIVNRIMIL